MFKGMRIKPQAKLQSGPMPRSDGEPVAEKDTQGSREAQCETPPAWLQLNVGPGKAMTLGKKIKLRQKGIKQNKWIDYWQFSPGF